MARKKKKVQKIKRKASAGKFSSPKEEKEEFDFFAKEFITVRAPGQDFYLCCVLDDVTSKCDQINVAWYDKVSTDKYKISHDDRIYKASVLTRVQLKPVAGGDHLYYIPTKHLKETQELLKESLENEGEEYIPKAATGTDEDDEPASKKKKSNRGSMKATKQASRKTATKETKKPGSKRKIEITPKRRKGLIPNPKIKLLSKDPTFCRGSDVPLIGAKHAIRAVLSDNKQLLKKLIADVKNIYSVQWFRSYHIKYSPMHYAFLKQDKKFLALLKDADMKRKGVTALEPKFDVSPKSSGTYNFYTFGHAVREITVSRGNKEGDNALLYNDGGRLGDGSSISRREWLDLLVFALKHNVSYDIICETIIMRDGPGRNNIGTLYEAMNTAVIYGHLELAGEIMSKTSDSGGYGFNFLHKEVLVNRTEPLSAFKAASVKKKTYVQKKVAPIHFVCINPNVRYVENIFKVLPEYNFPDWQDNRPIHYASACVGDGPLKYLLQRGVDPNTQNKVFETPLMIAAKCNRTHNIRVLMKCTIDEEDENGDLKKQVNIDAKSKTTKTALHYAAKKGHVEAVKTLIEHGAKLDIQTAASKENMTPLGYAASKGHYNVVKLLVEKGANLEFKMRRNKTALIYACMNGHSEIVAYLLNIGVNPDARDSSDNTPLHYAAAYGWFYCVKLLLEGGANPSVANNWKTTPLSITLLKQHVEIGDLLLSCDLDVNFPDDHGRTLVIKNVRMNFTGKQVDLLKHLVGKHKADVGCADIDGWTALHYLAANSVYVTKTEQRQITDYGSVNIQVFEKKPSDISIEIAKVLLDAGADVNAVNNDEESVLMVAIRQHHYPLVEFLMKNGASPSNLLHLIFEHVSEMDENINLMELFPEQVMTPYPTSDHPDIDDAIKMKAIFAIIDKERTALDSKAKIELLRAVLAKQLNVNEILPTGESGLFIAVENENLELCRFLIDHKANAELGRNSSNENILHLLSTICSTEFDVEQILSLVMENMTFSTAFVNEVDNQGYTPLLRAASLYHATQSSSNDDGDERYEKMKRFIEILITKCNADITATVAPEKNNGETDDVERHGPHGKMNILFFLQKPVNGIDVDQSILHMAVKHLVDSNDHQQLFNQRDHYGRTVLHFALLCHGRELDTLKYLVQCGCDVNLRSENIKEDDGASTLLLASQKNADKSIISYLIGLTDDVNLGNEHQFNMAHNIASGKRDAKEKIEIFTELLDKGLNINSQDSHGRTALHYAVANVCGDYEEMTEFEEFLISRGAKLNIACNQGRYPLHYAFTQLEIHPTSGNRDPMSTLKLLCEVEEDDLLHSETFEEYINHCDVYKRSGLHYGCMQGATISCSKLRKHNADDSLEDIDGNSPFALAMKFSHHGCAMTMLQQGASPVCDVITSVTQQQMETYQSELEQSPWRWNHVVPKPKQKILSAFQIAIQNDWKDIAYLMLELSGLPLIYALKAALMESKGNLVYTLLHKQKDNRQLLARDEHKRNLFHLFGKHIRKPSHYINTYPDFFKFIQDDESEEEGVRKQLRRFINAGVKFTDVDSKRKTALHYAVKKNYAIASFFFRAAPSQVLVKDLCGRTPLEIAINEQVMDPSSSIRDIIRSFVDYGVDMNLSYKKKASAQSTTTILNEVVLSRDKSFLEYLTDNGADLNSSSEEGVTPLMLAIQMNFGNIVDILLTKKVDLRYQDQAGNSYAHICVQSLQYGSYENTSIMKKLIEAGAPTALKNKKNETPLHLAMKQRSGAMKDILTAVDSPMEVDYALVDHGFIFERDAPIVSRDAYDFNSDAQAEIKLRIGDVVKVHQKKVMVDKAIDMSTHGEVYYDPAENRPYDVILTKVDASSGHYGLSLFYKLQVIHHKGKNLWILFNRWGRIGDSDGQHQQTPFDTCTEAVMEFEKIFRSKTGNLWSNLNSFVKKPKKYAVLLNERNPERMPKNHYEVLKPFDDKDSPLSVLSPSVKKFMKSISNVNAMMSKIGNVDRKHMPLGMISLEGIKQAELILDKLTVIFKNMESRGDILNTIEEHEEIQELSNEYYMLLPPNGYTFEEIRPIDRIYGVNDRKRDLKVISELCVAYKILVGAQHRINDVNPYDYCYNALNIRLEEMSPESAESKLISRFIFREGKRGSYDVENVFRVQQHNRKKFRDDLNNKYMMWHGTDTAHMMSILKDGLLLNPHTASRSGNSLGQGIYFSWDFHRSYYFTNRGGQNKYSYVLLCEVAFGKTHFYQGVSEEKFPPEGDDSVWCKSSEYPNPEKNVTMPYGPLMMVGNLIDDPTRYEKRKDGEPRLCGENEAVIYDEGQVKIRYIVQLRN